MATSDEWSRVGFTGNPVTGNPGVVDNITKELRGLSDLSGRVGGGLDALLAKAEDGGFEGRTADALRTYVKDELKTFMANINRSFDMAADATARYARALGDSQDRAENAADTVAALERVGGQPLAENDPEMTRARGEVDAEIDNVQAEAKILEDTLREAARLVSRPVKKPKKSFWKRFVSTFFKVLEIVALVITLIAVVIGGPLGLVAFGLGAVLFAKALVDYATGNGNALSLGLAFLGILFPSTKGLTTLSGLARMASSGAKALSGALSASGRLLFRGGRMLFSSPGRLLSLAGQGLVRFGGGLGSRAASGFMALPRVLSRTPAMLGSALRLMGGFARNSWRQGWSALTRDFVESTAFVGGNTAGRLGVFTIMSLGRLSMTALLPMRYSEIARFGYRGAARMGFIDRGLHFTPRALRPLGRTGSLAADLTNLTGRNLDRGGSLRPVTGTDTDRLVVPGTPEFNTTLDELAEISVTPVTTPRTPGFGSLTGPGTPRMPAGLDDMGVRLNALDTLDTMGLPVGTVPGGQRLGVLNPVTGRVGDDLMSPRLRTTLTLFDQVDEFGGGLTPGSPTTLLPPRTTVDQLRDLDELTGVERTGAGLLKPLDELSELAELSLDGKLGGLTEFQVSKILDGEIDLVNVTPDGVVLRVGKTDPVDVRVRLKDGVKVDVLGPADPRVPTWNSVTGGNRMDELGIRLDDLTRLIPDTTDGSRDARELLGLGQVRTDLTTPVTGSTTFTPLTLRDIVTGGATGKLATERFQAWVRTQATQLQLDTAGRGLGELDGLTDVPPLSRAKAQLDLSAAQLDFNRSRIAFDRLGMNLDTVRRDVTVMMARIDGPGATLPTGELRLLDNLGRPTGQWITMEPGPTVNWVLKGDSGVVPDVKVTMTDGVFTLTPPDGLATRIGPDGSPLLDDVPVRLGAPAGPSAAPQGGDPVRVPGAPEVTAPSVPQVHWLVRQDADFSATVGKSGMKTRLTEDGLVPVRIDGTITPLQAVSTANAKVFKENSPFTAFSAPGSTAKPFGNSEIGLDLVSLSNDITAGADSVKGVRILSNTELQQEILKEIRFAVGDSTLEIPSKFTHLTKNDDIKKFLAEYNVPKKLGASVTTDIKTLLQVRRDNTWLVQGAIPKEYLTGPYATVDSLKFVPAAPAATTPVQAPTDLLESAGRATGSGMPSLETPQPVLRTDDFFMSNVDLEQLRGVKLIRQDDFHALEVDTKGLRKSHFEPDIGMVPANPDGRTTAFQHVAGAEIVERKSNSPFTSFAVAGGEKVYGDTEFALDVYKLGLDIKAGNLQNVGILPARDLQQLIGDQIERTIGKRLDFSGLTGTSSRNDVVEFLRKNDVNVVGRGGKDAIGKIAGDVRVLLNTTRDQEWLIKGTIPRSYLEGPYPRATGPQAAGGPVPVGDALRGLDEAAGDLRLSDTFKTDFEVKAVSVEWRTPAGTNSGRLLESRVGELGLLDDLGRPTGQWITMEPGQTVSWVLRTDSGIVPDVRVDRADDIFTLTTPDGIVTGFGADGRPTGLGDLGPVSVPQVPRTGVDEVVLPPPGEMDRPALAADRSVDTDSFRLDRFDAPAPRSETVLLNPQQVTGVPGVRMEWQRTPLDDGGFALTDQAGDIRLVFTADEVLQFRDVRFPGADGFLRFEAAPGPGALPRVVGTDGLPLSGGVVIEPVRGALNVVTGVRVQSPDGTWIGRFDLDGTRLSEQLTLSGPVGGPLTGTRLTTTFTQLPGGGTAPAYRLTVPGTGDGAFSVVRLDGELSQRLPGGFAMTDPTGARLVFDRGGRLVDLPADGAAPTRLDVSGSVAPEATVGPPTALDGLGGPLPERLPLATAPGNGVLDDVTTDLTGRVPADEQVSMEGLAIPAPPRVAPPPAPAPPRVAPPPVPAAPPTVHLPETPVTTRPARAVAPGFDSSFPAPSIGTESELGGFVVALPGSADRTFAFVTKVDTDEPLLMVTKDMGTGGYTNPARLPMAQHGNWQTHTVELITYPSRLGDQVAIGARNDATQWLLDVFKDRLGVHNHRPLESMISPDGLYRLQVTSDRHVIAAGTGLELEGLPSVSMPTTQQQATIGIRAVDFGTRATHELRLLADHAHWYKPAFRNDDALRTALVRETLDAPEQVENAYTYTKSVIEFTSDLVNRHGIPIEDWAGAPPYHGLTHPAVKNEWKVLPRTRPSLVLDSLSPGDRAVTLRLLRETPAIGDESIWTAARQYILNGNEVAGRGINNATVGGERALLFEFRTLPDELKGSVPHEKAPVSLVTDPLAELGGNRVAAVQKINDFVAGPENRDAFADWYRAEFPRDPDAGRIHQNKSTASILRMAAARHKAEWIAARHPQTWQDITARTPAVVGPPASAVPSAPPVAPHVAAGPLPDELGRPVGRAGGPDVPGVDLTRITQGPTSDLSEPGVDLTRITQGPASDLSGPTGLRQSLDSPVPPGSSVREIPLSGLDDVTGLRLRVTEVPATDTVPASVRLEMVDFTAQGGQVRLPDVSVTVREGGGFTATGPQGGVRWQFDSLGQLEYRELPLSGTDFALRFTDDALNAMTVVGRDGVPVRGAAVTPVGNATGALSELTVRVPMPGTDGLTAVWRFEPGGLLRQQELPITLPGLDGSAGLGIKVTVTPGAGGTTTRVVELTGPQHLTGALRLTPVDSTLSGRLPNGLTVTDTITHSRFHFDADHHLVLRDLADPEGPGFLRFTEDAAPGTAPVRLDGLGGLAGLPEGIALDDAAQIVIRRLDDATSSPDRSGLRPELLNDQLRQMTGQALQTLRQHAVTTLGGYLDRPPAIRLDDLRSMTVAQGTDGRVIGDFTVTPTPHGGPGGSRYTVHHGPSDVTLGFGPNRELLYQEVFLRGGPGDLNGLRVGITGRSADGGPWTPGSLDFVGARPADGLFTTAPNPRGGFTVTDAASTTSWHYGPEGVHTLRDVRLPGDRGILRFDADAPGGVPRVLDSADRPLPGVRPELLDDGGIALVPTGKAAQPMERTVFSDAGTLLEETIAVRIKGGKANGEYWRIDHATSAAVRVDSSGTPLTGRFATAKVEMSATGRFKLTGEGNVTLFEREVLRNGNVLHIDLDRVGRARWSEFDPAGTKVRSGERIWDGDRRTVHDTLSYRWAPMDVLDVRTYTKAIDGGLIRAEKGAGGDWTWTRFDSGGTEVLSGTREWSWNHIGFKDTYIDPVTGQRTVAHRRGDIWPLNGYHGSRQYLEHPVLPGQSPAGMRVNPELHSAVGPANKPIDVIEHLADGGTLHVVRISDQRMPAALWQTRTGVGRFDGFVGNLVSGDSMFAVSKWTETAADGTRLKGVRLVSHGGHGWRDVDQFGRIVRETRKLENGDVVEVGRSLDDPKQWAPAPKWNGSADPYELPWLDTTSGVSGTRRVAGDGSFEDVFTNAAGDELLSMRSQGTGVREYLGENPARGIGRDDVSGVWVDKNTQSQITGRRDQWGDLRIEAHGNPRHRTWQWKATGPDGTATEGIRMQNRGSLYSRTWDDSFVDFERLENGRPGQALRERSATDDGTVWVDATRQPDHTWTWRKTDADGTVHSQGVREYQDFAKGHWTDRIGDDVVRRRTGGRVREYAYTVEETAPPALTPSALTPPPETGPTTLADLLSRSARHFEPTTTVTVDREVWREFDMGKVLHRRDAVEGAPGRYREAESLWGQWREYQDSRLVAQRTITGRIWATDTFGRWSAFDVAKLPEVSSLPSVGGQVGLDGHRAWRLIGREVDFRGYTTEFRGVNREFRDPFHEIWTGVQDGSSAAMPLWRHELRKAATEFATGFLIEFGTSFAVSAIVSEFANTRFDPLVAFERAMLNGAVGGGIRAGFNVAQDMTALGKIKYGLANLDQGQNWNRHSLASADDWAGEWSSYENPVRWRSGTYAFFDGLAVSALTGFVNSAANAAIWGVGGQKHTGLEALEAGAWGAAGSLFTGVTSGMARYTFHTTAGSRIFHRGGPGELIWQSAESLTTGILNYWINTRGAHIDSTHPFPPSTTGPTTPSTSTPTTPSQGTRQPAVSPIEGLELT
ncbi:actin cross-linking domain-containing toxin [Streptomyces europaeiscabiei]|uniref:actin cross-linking domain-containing toxin n=1 Tax=Streptomyces europaeiscabiei TaxID=146819 RepID=UPI0029BAC4FE|nr:actin cross-linking domain-containing toxin [Streptomyces europaeiscabiei]MDX3629323.1 actin cross-linking domain-containing toxin [Streptomyces europaeiscabiei]MDX3647059.1 actin cross-linking domain-containing toxin [Streptomyces europaeiscabiei]